MKEFIIEFEASAPMWDNIVIEAKDKSEAEDLAYDQISMSFPEASDIVITDVKEKN